MGDGVGCYACGRGQKPRSLFAKAASVVGIKIPLATNGFFALHQDAVFLAQLAVEIFKAQLLASLGVGGKVAHGAEEMRVVFDLKWQVVLLCDRAQALHHTPVAGRSHHQLLRLHFCNGFGQFTGQRARVVRIVELAVHQRPAACLQVCSEVPHGAQENSGALFGRGNMRGLFHHLGHPQRVVRRVNVAQGGGIFVELIAQDEDEAFAWLGHVGCF